MATATKLTAEERERDFSEVVPLLKARGIDLSNSSAEPKQFARDFAAGLSTVKASQQRATRIKGLNDRRELLDLDPISDDDDLDEAEKQTDKFVEAKAAKEKTKGADAHIDDVVDHATTQMSVDGEAAGMDPTDTLAIDDPARYAGDSVPTEAEADAALSAARERHPERFKQPKQPAKK
jgi:hypothetical protein